MIHLITDYGFAVYVIGSMMNFKIRCFSTYVAAVSVA